MGIATIPSYRMPSDSALPEALVDWRPDRARAALLIHDMQRYFINPYPSAQAPVAELVANIRLLADRAHLLGMPVLYTAQPGGMTRADRGLLHDFWGAGMSRNTADTEIIPELVPGPEDAVFTKWRYSAFLRSDLERRLRGAGRDQLIVCGVYAHVGCLITACDAFSRDIESFFVADAVADFTEEYHRLALRYTAERCAVTTTTGRLLDMLVPAHAESRFLSARRDGHAEAHARAAGNAAPDDSRPARDDGRDPQSRGVLPGGR